MDETRSPSTNEEYGPAHRQSRYPLARNAEAPPPRRGHGPVGDDLPVRRRPEPAPVSRVQRLAQVMTPHGVRARPDGHAPVLEVVQPRRPITNERTILPVLARERGKQGVMWLKVLLPGRPNGHTGWIKQPGTVGAITRWAIVIHLSQRRVDVFHTGRLAELPRRRRQALDADTAGPLLRRGVAAHHARLPGRPVRPRAQRALERLPGIRRRPRPDRAARHLPHRRNARHCRLARLRPPGQLRDGVGSAPTSTAACP